MAVTTEQLHRLVDALRGVGFTIPDEVEGMGVEGVIIAVKASGGADRFDDRDDDNDAGMAEGEQWKGETVASAGGGSPALMSDGRGGRATYLRRRKRPGNPVIARQEELARFHSAPKAK